MTAHPFRSRKVDKIENNMILTNMVLLHVVAVGLLLFCVPDSKTVGQRLTGYLPVRTAWPGGSKREGISINK